MERQERIRFQFGVTPEQSCIMCHLSAECSDCCKKCKVEGCHGQNCSLPSRDHDGQRWENWLYIVANFRPDLRRFVPRKYHKYINQKKIY